MTEAENREGPIDSLRASGVIRYRTDILTIRSADHLVKPLALSARRLFPAPYRVRLDKAAPEDHPVASPYRR